MAVAFRDSIEAHEKQLVKSKDNQKVVLFSQGCITKYEVTWGKADNESAAATSWTANITSLSPATKYKFHVKTEYVSGDVFQSDPAEFTTAKTEAEPKECQCDHYGTIAPSLGCNLTGSKYCNCKDGYEGSFCEVCAPGYYKTAPHFPCHRCPCDHYATRKRSCQFVEGFLRCDSCEVGYTGNICHTCASGFYRLNHRCVPCFCTGNTAPGAEPMCSATTGKCLQCQHNTTGDKCDLCLPGYVGDPINFKNCTKEDEVRARHMIPGASPGVVAAVVVTLLLIGLLLVAAVWFARFYFREKRRAFWTVEMNRDSDDVGFSSVQNHDAQMDDVDLFPNRSVPASAGKYSRLQEEF
ncbi:unnamed protein product [Candidula unifasciata]|uniref:Laminin EGF-like domain-containing protein n=1 Tax=Candidula unifasciata TaxID=100452 RepID=A0A8S4A5U5_9EUPU|nr:unnamed protein product [Candidula unifasciata]